MIPKSRTEKCHRRCLAEPSLDSASRCKGTPRTPQRDHQRWQVWSIEDECHLMFEQLSTIELRGDRSDRHRLCEPWRFVRCFQKYQEDLVRPVRLAHLQGRQYHRFHLYHQCREDLECLEYPERLVRPVGLGDQRQEHNSEFED